MSCQCEEIKRHTHNIEILKDALLLIEQGLSDTADLQLSITATQTQSSFAYHADNAEKTESSMKSTAKDLAPTLTQLKSSVQTMLTQLTAVIRSFNRTDWGA